MKKYFFYAAILLLFPLTAAVSADSIKIGFVNAQKVFEHSSAGKQVQEKIKEFVESRQKVLSLEDQDLQEMKEKFERQIDLLSPEAKKIKQNELQKKFTVLRRKAGEFENEILEKKREINKTFLEEIKAIIQEISKEDGYTLVLDQSEGSSPVLYSQEPLNITDKVIARLDKASEK